MKPSTIVLGIIVAAVAASSEPIKDQLEGIAANWFKAGFTCGQVDILSKTGNPVHDAEASCAKWNARFKNEGK